MCVKGLFWRVGFTLCLEGVKGWLRGRGLGMEGEGVFGGSRVSGI